MNSLEPRKASPFAIGLRILNSLKNPSYRIYLLGSLSHFAAMSMQMVSNPMLIFRLTDSKALLGTMALASAAPMILISIFGGAIADKLPKKKIVLAGVLLLAVTSVLIGLSLSYGILNRENPESWSILFISSAIQGCIMGLMMPALQAIIPEIVAREQLMNATALNSTGMNVLSLIAPGVAGFIIGDSNFQAVFYTMAGLYVLSAIFFLFVSYKSEIIASGNKIMGDIQQGFSYIRKESLILLILVFTLIVTVLTMPYQQLMPVFVDEILNVGAPGMGLLMSVSGGGALVGSLILAALPNKKRGIMLLLSGALSGAALAVFSFSSLMSLSLVFMFFVGLSQTFRMTISSAILQAYTAGAYMGRVMSILNMQWGVMSLCTFFAGIIAERVDVQWVLGSLSMLCIVLSFVFVFLSSNIRKMD